MVTGNESKKKRTLDDMFSFAAMNFEYFRFYSSSGSEAVENKRPY